MIYFLLKQWIRVVLKLFVSNLSVRGLEFVPKQGATLLAINHPNSFFDAILVVCQLSRSVHSLARGDVFRKTWAKAILSQFNMSPVHRLSEGKEHLGENNETFHTCLEIFRKGGVVLIFSEGLCSNQTELLPLKKGTARLVRMAWQEGIDLQVVPIGLTYDSFDKFGKTIELNVSESIKKEHFSVGLQSTEGQFFKNFNEVLRETLEKLIKPKPEQKRKNLMWLFLYVFHLPLILFLQPIVKRLSAQTFYDSVLFGTLVFTVPFYWWGLIKLI